MGSKSVPVLAALLLVAGASLAWFLTRRDSGARGSAATATAPERPSVSPRPASPLEDGGGLVSAGGGEVVRERIAESPAAVSTAAAPAPAGTSVAGRVIDPYGAPVAGAEVVASDREGLPLDLHLDPASPFAGRRSTVVTDAEGRFTLQAMEPGTLALLVRKPGYAPYSESRIPVPAGDRHTLDDVVLHPGAVLEGRVVDPYGQPVAGAELHVEEFESPFRFAVQGAERPEATTDAQGAFRLDQIALGAWRVRVESDEHPSRTFEGLSERAGEVTTRTFELPAGQTLTGRVTGVPENEARRLFVRASPASARGFFGFSGPGTREAEVAADGAFALAGLEAGELYVVQAHVREMGASWFRFNGRTRSARVEAQAGARGVEIPYQPEAAVLFRAVDARTGEPVEEFEVGYGFRWTEPLTGGGPGPLREHPGGNVRIGDLRPDESPQDLKLRIDAVGYRRFERAGVPVHAGREIDLGDLRVEPLPLVVVRVVDQATGEPVPGAEVRIREEESEGRDFELRRSIRASIAVDAESGEQTPIGEPGTVALTGEDGVARLNSIEGRRCTVTVTRDGYAPASVPALYLPPGEPVERTVALGPGGEVLVRVVDESGAAMPGIRVDHRAPDEEDGGFLPFLAGRRESISDSAGEVRFPHLAAGEHGFRIHRDAAGRRGRVGGGGFVFTVGSSGGADWTTVDVAAGESVEVTLVQGALGALAGRVSESGADLVGATVRVRPDRGEQGNAFGGLVGGGGGERTDSTGRYRIEDLEPGPYRVTIEHPKRRMPMTFEVEVDPGENRFDADLPVSVVEGRVTDQDGKPLAGVEVAARRISGESARGRVVMFQAVSAVGGGGGGGQILSFDDALGDSVRTDADGRYSLRGVAPDVELVIRASGEDVQGADSKPFTVKPDEVRRGVDVRLEAAGSIDVEVLAADGTPADFVFLRASYLDEVPEGSSGPGTDPRFTGVQGGKASLTGLRPGRWSVEPNPFAGPGGDPPDGPEPQEVEVEAGRAAHLTFRLP